MIPDAQYAAELCRRLLGKSPRQVTRFPDGLCHYVFEATFDTHDVIFMRLAEESARSYMAGGIYWSPRLHALDANHHSILSKILVDILAGIG